MTKRCPQCKQIRPTSEFNRRTRSSDGLGTYCKQCKSIRDRSWRERNREYKGRADKNFLLKKRFGITLREFERLLQAQNGICAICKKPETQISKHGSVQMLAANRNPSTGQVHGLLCAACRFGLVKLKNDTANLQSAIAYLVHFR